jgi:hypothetical protein
MGRTKRNGAGPIVLMRHAQVIGKGGQPVPDERDETDDAPADGPQKKERRPRGATSQPAPTVPPQSSRGTPAPSASQRDRDVAAAKAAERASRTRFAKAAVAGKTTVIAVRTRVAEAVWLAAVVAAVALSLGALLIALHANQDNVLVSTVLDIDRAIDGPFWKVFDFYKHTKSGAQGSPDDVKNHLVNWGLAAAAYLVAGRLLNRAIRPKSR